MRRAILLFLALQASACVGPPPEACIQCGNQCVDTRVDAQHCGSCGTLCGLGKTCSDSACVAAVSSVSVDPTSATLAIGATFQLTATPKDGTGNPLTGRTIVWTSSSPTVAIVALDGVVTGLAAGAAQITANVEGQSASATVTVAPPPIATISVNVPSSSIGVGSTLQASGEARDALGNVLDRPFTWATDTTVATVNSAGLVTANRAGTVSVSASAEGKTGSRTITVLGTPTLSISSITPSHNATGVSIEGKVVITFSENVDASTVTATSVALSQNGSAVITTRTVSGPTVTLTPEVRLTEYKTPYVVTVGTGVKSSAGNLLPSSSTFSFTTAFFDQNYYYRLKSMAQPANSLDTDPSTFVARVSTTASNTGQYWYFVPSSTTQGYFTFQSALGTNSRALEAGNEPDPVFLTSAATIFSGMLWQGIAVGSASPGKYYLRTLNHGSAKSLGTPLVSGIPVPMMKPTASDPTQYWSFTRLAHR